MGQRIITLQRGMRELGRLRNGLTGTSSTGKVIPVKSPHWILTSHQPTYLNAAAATWGGTVEPWTPAGQSGSSWRLITTTTTVDAFLPPGDSLSQTYELWSRGGCQRRCDGQTETLANRPCLCRAEHGEDFHTLPPTRVCRPHTRLGVILPDIPDVGVWRMETHGWYAAREIVSTVDMIREVTESLVPIRLRIEPRTRIVDGRTKSFQVVVVELRGTARQLLGGRLPAIESLAGEEIQVQDRAAITAPTARGLLALVGRATSVEQLERIPGRDVPADDPDLPKLRAAYTARLTELRGSMEAITATPVVGQGPTHDDDDSEPTEDHDADADAMWAEILEHVPTEWDMDTLERHVIDVLNVSSSKASAEQLARYLEVIKSMNEQGEGK